MWYLIILFFINEYIVFWVKVVLRILRIILNIKRCYCVLFMFVRRKFIDFVLYINLYFFMKLMFMYCMYVVNINFLIVIFLEIWDNEIIGIGKWKLI